MNEDDNSGSAGPITSVTLTGGAPVRDQQQPIEQVKAPEPEPVDPANQVTIKAIRSFHGVEGWKSPRSEPFTVSKLRAADLFAVGLIEYVDEADEDAAIQAVAEAQIAPIKAAAERRRAKK